MDHMGPSSRSTPEPHRVWEWKGRSCPLSFSVSSVEKSGYYRVRKAEQWVDNYFIILAFSKVQVSKCRGGVGGGGEPTKKRVESERRTKRWSFG